MCLGAEQSLTIRTAGPADARLVFDLSNDPVVREVSFSSDVITWQAHLAWFERTISSGDTVFLLAFKGDSFVGQVRFEFIAEAEAEISISLHSSFRSKGFGRAFMESALEYVVKNTAVRVVHAYAKPSNEASHRFFLACGFLVAPDAATNGDTEPPRHYLRNLRAPER